jgi:RNA polymerase sigma-70 factor (ECF subfamily)
VESDATLLEALRAGDERAFLALAERYHAAMLRVARLHVRSLASAEDAVQEAWLGVLRGLRSYEGRASLRAWIFAIVVNCARRRGAAESRTVPLSALEVHGEEGPAVPADRFLPDEHPSWPGHWASPPEAWPEERVLAREAALAAKEAIAALPPAQRQVITLRDVEGLDGPEVSSLLGVSEGNQRVLLHRARAKVRAALEERLSGAAAFSG